jgi:hypothetical protein
MSDFDHAKYREGLSFLAKMAYDEYRHVCLDIPKYQATLLRTYLWLSSLIATLEAGFYFKAVSGEIFWAGRVCVTSCCFYFFAGISLTASLAAFALGVDTLRGRGMSTLPLGDFNVLAEKAYEMASDPSSSKLYPTIIKALNAEISRQTASKSKKGKKLRAMSALALVSVFFSILAIIALFGAVPA